MIPCVKYSRQVYAYVVSLDITSSLPKLMHRLSFLQYKDEAAELEDLRELKSDIERRERAQATVIENQAKRLDELEVLYKVLQLLVYSSSCKSYMPS